MRDGMVLYTFLYGKYIETKAETVEIWFTCSEWEVARCFGFWISNSANKLCFPSQSREPFAQTFYFTNKTVFCGEIMILRLVGDRLHVYGHQWFYVLTVEMGIFFVKKTELVSALSFKSFFHFILSDTHSSPWYHLRYKSYSEWSVVVLTKITSE